MDTYTELRIIVRNEGDMWVAQCVDFDIATQGRTPAECRRNMIDQLDFEAKLSHESTGEVFGGIPKPPAEIERQWDCAEANSFKGSGHLGSDGSHGYEMRMVG